MQTHWIHLLNSSVGFVWWFDWFRCDELHSERMHDMVVVVVLLVLFCHRNFWLGSVEMYERESRVVARSRFAILASSSSDVMSHRCVDGWNASKAWLIFFLTNRLHFVTLHFRWEAFSNWAIQSQQIEWFIFITCEAHLPLIVKHLRAINNHQLMWCLLWNRCKICNGLLLILKCFWKRFVCWRIEIIACG